MPNPFDYMQLISNDHEKAKEFYSQLFDWKVEDTPIGNNLVQTIIKQPEGPSSGIMPATGPSVPSMWHVYVQVMNIDESLYRVVQLGGTVLVPKTPVAGSGFIPFIQDPTGAALGITQRDETAIIASNALVGMANSAAAAGRAPPKLDAGEPTAAPANAPAGTDPNRATR